MNGVAFHKALRAVLCRTDITPLDKLVFVALLDVSSDSGVAWPTTETVGEMLGVNPRSVRRSLGALLSRGIIETDSRSGGKKSTRYVIANPDNLTGLEACQPGQKWSSTRPNCPPNPAKLSANPAKLSSDRLITDSLTDLESAGADECPHDIPTDGMDSRPSPLEEAMQKLLGQSRANFRFRNKEQVATLLREKHDVESLIAIMEGCISDGKKWDEFIKRAWGIGKKDKPEDVTQVKAAKGKYDRFR